MVCMTCTNVNLSMICKVTYQNYLMLSTVLFLHKESNNIMYNVCGIYKNVQLIQNLSFTVFQDTYKMAILLRLSGELLHTSQKSCIKWLLLTVCVTFDIFTIFFCRVSKQLAAKCWQMRCTFRNRVANRQSAFCEERNNSMHAVLLWSDQPGWILMPGVNRACEDIFIAFNVS